MGMLVEGIVLIAAAYLTFGNYALSNEYKFSGYIFYPQLYLNDSRRFW